VVYLTASPGVIIKRTWNDTNRPLLNTYDRLQRIRELLKFRRPFYERAADITVGTSRASIETVVLEIIEKLKSDESFHF